MKNIVKMNLYRLFRNIYFIIGCVLAAVITFFYTSHGEEINIQHYVESPTEYMIFISVGAVVLFSILSAFMVNVENFDGVLRNKIISGHSQREVYFAHLITQFVFELCIIAAWFIGGIAGGAKITSNLLIYIVLMIFFCLAYISVLTAIGMRIKTQVVAVALSIGVFYLCFNGMLIGNYITMISADTPAALPAGFIYNMDVIGQWFARSSFGYEIEEVNIGFPLQLLASITVIVIANVIGNLKLNTREVH